MIDVLLSVCGGLLVGLLVGLNGGPDWAVVGFAVIAGLLALNHLDDIGHR